jgi:hypothetical protein
MMASCMNTMYTGCLPGDCYTEVGRENCIEKVAQSGSLCRRKKGCKQAALDTGIHDHENNNP